MAAGQWYLVVNGAQAGPFSQDDVMARLRAGQIDRATLVFTAGMSQWTPLGQVPQLAGAAASGFAAPPPAAAAAASARTRSTTRSSARTCSSSRSSSTRARAPSPRPAA